MELEGNQGRRWNDSNSSRDELEGYMVIQEASVVHSSGELEIKLEGICVLFRIEDTFYFAKFGENTAFTALQQTFIG